MDFKYDASRNIDLGGNPSNISVARYIQTMNGIWKPLSISIYDVNTELEKYIINENATILFWNDGTKTISKRHKEDKFDKELGYLYAYFYKKYKGNKASMKRVLDCIDFKNIKTFLLEFYINDSGKSREQAKKYLSNLVVEKK